MVFELINSLEEKFVYQNAKEWAQKYWTISIYASIIYVVSIFSIKWYMTNRQPFDLRRWLFAWSLMLSLFSIVGFCHTGIPLISALLSKGFHSTVCKPQKTSNWEDDLVLLKGAEGLWGFMFCLSKIPELGDTFFVVLRKKKLIFLHWYHHITVMMYCYFQYAHMIAAAQWFIVMNYFVHSIMYMYYAVTAVQRVRPPKWVNMLITLLQLLQMVGGIYVNVYISRRMYNDADFYCDEMVETTYLFTNLAFAMYFSYFILFIQFFYSAYFKPRPVATKASSSDTSKDFHSDKVSSHRVQVAENEAYPRKGVANFMNTNGNAASADASSSNLEDKKR